MIKILTKFIFCFIVISCFVSNFANAYSRDLRDCLSQCGPTIINGQPLPFHFCSVKMDSDYDDTFDISPDLSTLTNPNFYYGCVISYGNYGNDVDCVFDHINNYSAEFDFDFRYNQNPTVSLNSSPTESELRTASQTYFNSIGQGESVAYTENPIDRYDCSKKLSGYDLNLLPL